MVFGLPDLEINKSHELQHVELFAGQCAEGRAAIAMDLEIGGPTMDLTTNEGFLAALYHTCRLKPGSGWLAAPVCHDIVEDVDDFRPRWLPPREAVEMAVVYQDGRGVTRVKGGRHLKASQAYPLGFGKALSAVRNRHAARIRSEARVTNGKIRPEARVERGMSVEEFMEEMSAKCLEAQVDARMQQLATEHPAPPTDDEEEEVERPKGKKGEDVKKPGEGDEEEDEGDGEDEMSSLSEDASESDGPDGSVDSEEEEEVSSEEEEGEDGDEGEDDSEEEEEAQEEAAVEKDFTKLLDDADEDETQKGVKDKKKKEEEKPNAEKLKDAVVKGEEDFSKANSVSHKARDLYKKYPKEKADLLMKKLKEKGMWHYDPDFEGDEEEIFYYASEDNVMSDESIFRDITKVSEEEKYAKHFQLIVDKIAWYEKAEAVQKALPKGRGMIGSGRASVAEICDAQYRQERIISPWTRVEGWHLGSCFHDPMHVLLPWHIQGFVCKRAGLLDTRWVLVRGARFFGRETQKGILGLEMQMLPTEGPSFLQSIYTFQHRAR
ncbi:unnamed protein product [Durusdinium trenchii]|uniref:Uncharacterized protein n=1 Tax=Durusdinium trenchii TaxID=1381693 RepID=A0ABP0MJ38_9DINO